MERWTTERWRWCSERWSIQSIIILLLLPLTLCACDRRTIVAHQMTWEFREPSKEWVGAEHIFLRFVSFPSYGIGIYSQDLGPYLRSVQVDSIPVTFEVFSDLGCTSGFNEIRIGELDTWDSRGGYFETQGDHASSPWDDKQCWLPWR